jgi:hypothetical protein
MSEITIHYEKNPEFRTVYTDGLIGGITPTGMVNLNFYATRNIIPKSVAHEVTSDGKLENPGVNSEESKDGIVREIELGVYMNQDTAMDIYEFFKKMFNDGV